LRRYNDGVNVLDTRSSSEQLRNALETIHSDNDHNVFLLPLHINVVDGNFQQGNNNHFVGLMITRSAEGNNYEAQY
jgi:phosphomannomutase